MKSAYPTQIKPTFRRPQPKKRGLSFKVTGKPVTIQKVDKTVNPTQAKNGGILMLDPKSSRKSQENLFEREYSHVGGGSPLRIGCDQWGNKTIVDKDNRDIVEVRQTLEIE